MRGTLRSKPISDGKKLSLYIDYYPKVWNPIKRKFTRREFLQIHLVQFPQNSREKDMNAVNQEIAEKIYVSRMKSLMLEANGFFNKDVLESDFFIFAEGIIQNKGREGIGTRHYEMAIKYLRDFVGEYLRFRQIDELFIQRFKDFLLIVKSYKGKSKLARNTASCYFDKFLFICTEAFKQKYLTQDYTSLIDRISTTETHFELLDDKELQILLDNPCRNELIFKSSIFALLTGLRFGAIKALKWNNFHRDKIAGGWYIHFIDPKPGRNFTHYISQQAINILGKPPRSRNQLVFHGLSYSSMRYNLQMWFSSLGLGNKAKFHNWRRLYATKLLESGEDIYTVSKMINHKSIKTTTRYVQVRMKSRLKAAGKIELNSKNLVVAKMLRKTRNDRSLKE